PVTRTSVASTGWPSLAVATNAAFDPVGTSFSPAGLLSMNTFASGVSLTTLSLLPVTVIVRASGSTAPTVPPTLIAPGLSPSGFGLVVLSPSGLGLSGFAGSGLGLSGFSASGLAVSGLGLSGFACSG